MPSPWAQPGQTGGIIKTSELATFAILTSAVVKYPCELSDVYVSSCVEARVINRSVHIALGLF